MRRSRVFYAVALVPLVGLVALGVGRYPIPPGEVYGILLSRGSWGMPADEIAARVVLLSRLPRVLLAMLVGGGLGTAGAVLQGLFRNPLVGPQVLGVSSAAAFGGALAILLDGSWVLQIAGAAAFGFLALVLVFVLNRVPAGTPVLMVVLAGVVIGAFFSACVSILTYVADPYRKLPAIVFWLLGSLATATYEKVLIAAVAVFVAGGMLLLLRWHINMLTPGDEEARALGVQVDVLRWACLVAVSALVAGAVAVSGVVGWVGLVVPHLARMLTGPDHRLLLPASFAAGAAYLTLMDTLARSLTPAEIPVGILTAIVGAPVFFALLRRLGTGGWVHG